MKAEDVSKIFPNGIGETVLEEQYSGGLIVDPLPQRLKELEGRVKRLEERTTPSAIRTVAQS